SPAITTVTVDFVVDWFTCEPLLPRAGRTPPPASPIVLHEAESSDDAAHAGARLLQALAQRRVLGLQRGDAFVQLKRVHGTDADPRRTRRASGERPARAGPIPRARSRAPS